MAPRLALDARDGVTRAPHSSMARESVGPKDIDI
jgi:hypothetical protein